MFSLFICITQDGWMGIREDLKVCLIYLDITTVLYYTFFLHIVTNSCTSPVMFSHLIYYILTSDVPIRDLLIN